MSKKIKVGDLAVVVRPSPCCGNTLAVGKVFRVSRVATESGMCRNCESRSVDTHALGGEYAYLVSRLKRIPPLDKLEGARSEEKLKEPA